VPPAPEPPRTEPPRAESPRTESARTEPPRTEAAPPDPIASAKPSGPTGFASALARGAGLPDEVFAPQNPDELAEQVGALLRMTAENMRQLLKARLQAKRMARSSKHTEIEALNNNPLKFSISADEALRNMFGPRSRGYLDARASFEQGFQDVKAHQVQTFTAMQQAITLLLADLDPQAIDTATEADRGIAGLVVSRKARLWDAYVARWQTLAGKQDADMLEHFMRHFAECYDRAGQGSP
jgi:type VI secretion system protein ImpI